MNHGSCYVLRGNPWYNERCDNIGNMILERLNTGSGMLLLACLNRHPAQRGKECINRMGVLALYLAITFVGYIAGSKLKKTQKNFSWTGKVQFVAIVILVFTMGSRIGADKSIMASLDSIGITALVITVFILAGSVGAVFLARKLLGFNKEGVKTDD
ncbi:MAG: lysine exporter LysO family protein [Firmicutes bacterium]|nr:lysine exporter LysO family protein [Bacillota bacterium]